MMEKVPNGRLLDIGLRLMAQSGRPLTKDASRGRAMLYRLANGETVRVRTCNDHILIVVADTAEENSALNIEGTDWLLLVMPAVPRTMGEVLAYLVPTEEAVREVRSTHRQWLSTNPNTRGANRTWNLWFDDDGPKKSAGYSRKWVKYRIQGTYQEPSTSEAKIAAPIELKAEVEDARIRIARAAGVPVQAVRISIDFQS